MAAGLLQWLSLSSLLISLLVASILRPIISNIDLLTNTPGSEPRILLLTAHPDDECMFFAPTLLSLLPPEELAPSPQQHPKVYSLCLSVGDADELGGVRKDELEKSLDVLGVSKGRRWVVDHPELRDNITQRWDAEVISSVLQPYIEEHKITTILTFDRWGVSSHPNHQSLPVGVMHHLSASIPTVHQTPRLFTLISVPLIHKYMGPTAAILARWDLSIQSLLEWLSLSPPTERLSKPGPSPAKLAVFVSGFKQYRAALRAMMHHRSQLVWFRWLYVTFSRYMWVNEWVEARV